MVLDFQLPLYAVGAASLLLAGVLATASVPSRGPDLQFWVGALLLVACADLAVSQQAVLGTTGSVAVTALATSLGLALAHLALQELLMEQTSYRLALAPVLVAGAGALAFADDPIVRTCVIGLVYAVQAANIFVFLMSTGQWQRMGAPFRLLTLGFAAICALFVTRVTMVLFRPDQILTTLQEKPAHLATLVFAVVGVVTCSFAFLHLRRNRYEEGLAALATRDDLTGILNRRTFMELGAHALSAAARAGRPVCVLMLDLDHFKAVNDRHGHAEGDRLLVEVSRTISGGLRESDIFGRYGGEEFCIVLPDTTATGAALIAARIRNAIGNRTYALGKTDCLITASIGVAAASGRPGDSIGGLIDRADAAMYRAKGNGRNQVEICPLATPQASVR